MNVRLKSILFCCTIAMVVASCVHARSTPDDLVLLPGGTFTMGCVTGDEHCQYDEQPAHRVTLSAFYLNEHEVTAAEYVACVKAHVCRAPESGEGFFDWRKPEQQNRPVTGVTWFDAQKFCQWKGGRLPTEAEFEFALRGGREGLIYPWGAEPTPPAKFANYADRALARSSTTTFFDTLENYDDGFAYAAPVCSFPRNPLGLCDLAGNVTEWTADWYGEAYYSTSPATNPRGPATGEYRVIRGGGWDSALERTRASHRPFFPPDHAANSLGFRCARDR